METPSQLSPDQAGQFERPSWRQRHKLANTVMAGGALVLVYLSYDSDRPFDVVFGLSLLIAAASIYPIYRWARDMKHQYPIFEIFLATNLTTYALPMITESEVISRFSEDVVQKAAVAVTIFIFACMAGYYGTNARPKRTAFWTDDFFSQIRPQLLATGLALGTAYILITNYFWSPPPGINGILRAAFFGITSSSIFILMLLWGRDQISSQHKVVVLLCIAIQFIVLSSTLILRSGASLVLLSMIGYFFGRRKIPWIALVSVFLVIGMLHNGKFHMRGKYWDQDFRQSPELAQLPDYYQEWFQAGLRGDPESETANSSLIERSSLIQMLCLVVDKSPDPRPFLGGETYGHILGQFIPRILWPEKPRGHVSTYTLSIHYGLQDEHATQNTTIAFGMVPEAYANFGLIGVTGLGLVIGLFYGAFTQWSLNSPLFSFAGMLIILLTAWSFQTELPLSAWLGSLSQAVVALLGIVFAFRRLF